MKAFVITAVSVDGAVGIVLVEYCRRYVPVDRTSFCDRLAHWGMCVGVGQVGAAPFLMDVVLAIAAGNVWGMPLGPGVEATAIYCSFIIACHLPLFSL